MATLNTSVTLKSATKVAGELTLDFAQLTDLAFTTAEGATVVVPHTGTHTTIVDGTHSDETYVYLKNTSGADKVKMYDATTEYGSVMPGAWTFITVPAGKILKCLNSGSGNINVNYVRFLK